MNNSNHAKGLHSALSRQILFQYVLSLLAWCAGLPLITFLAVLLVSSRTWYGSEAIYPFLDWARDYFWVLFVLALIFGLFVITIYFILKPLRYVDALVKELTPEEDTDVLAAEGSGAGGDDEEDGSYGTSSVDGSNEEGASS